MKVNKGTLRLLVLFGLVIGVSFLMRLLPHPANFIPLGALALVSGTYIRSKWGILAPLAVMVVSDLIIGLHSVILFTWGSFLFIGMIGWWIRQKKDTLRIVSGSLVGSILFFVITNFAVWAFTPLYSKTAAGLVQCFYMAIPFFRNTVLGDLFYVGIFFGLFEAVYFLAAYRERKPIPAVQKN